MELVIKQPKKRGRPPSIKNINAKKEKKSLLQKKQEKDLTSVKKPLETGLLKDVLDTQEQLEVINDTFVTEIFPEEKILFQPEETSATLEYPLLRKKKIWKDKLSILEIDTLNMKLLQTWDQVSTLNEKVLTPFWTQQSKDVSEKLWLPTEIDCVDSVLTSSQISSLHTPMGKSWFSITKKHPQNKNSLMTSFQSSQFSHPESMDLEGTKIKKKQLKNIIKATAKTTVLNFIKQATINVTNQILNIEPTKKIDRSRKNKDEKLKTLKFRMFPTEEEKRNC